MTITEERLDATFAALSDPTRRAILARLAGGDATVNQLAEPFAMSLPAVSKHLRVLERSGLISRGRHAQFRPCHLEPAALDQAVDCATDGVDGIDGTRAWMVLVNASPGPVQFTLPAGTWRLALSSAPDAAPELSPDPEELPPTSTLPESCIWIART